VSEGRPFSSVLDGGRPRVPVFHLARPLLTLSSAWRAAALAVPDVGVAVFFIAGVAASGAGSLAPWFVLLGVALGLACRAVDLEGWGLPVPGGPVGRASTAFGPRIAATVAGAQLIERALFASLVCVVFGRYVAALPVRTNLSLPSGLDTLARADSASVAAAALLCFTWVRARLGYATDARRAVIRTALAAVAMVGLLAIVLLLNLRPALSSLATMWPLGPGATLPDAVGPVGRVLAVFVALGHVLPAVGSGDSLARAASELEPPRIRGVRRTLAILTSYAGFVTVTSACLYVWIVPAGSQRQWSDVPLLGILANAGAPAGIRAFATLALLACGTLLLGQAARAGISGAERTLSQLAAQGRVNRAFAVPHRSFGTFARAADTAAAIAILAIVAGAGRVEWMAHAYAAALALTLVLKVAVLIRLRSPRSAAPFRVPLNLTVGGSEWPLGLLLIATIVAASWLALVVRGDAATIAASVALVSAALTFAAAARRAPAEIPDDADPLSLVSPRAVTLEQMDARPGGILVALRNPDWLAPLAHAFAMGRGREVVVLNVRLAGSDYDDIQDPRPSAAERALFSRVLSLAEQHDRTVKLLIVPATTVAEAIVAAILRVRATDVVVGESATLSSESQARLLGNAWEQSEATHLHGVQLVVLHRSGRSDNYHLGAHAPMLSPTDLDLIHQVWLDATKALGPHVHHHDVVRAALTHMSEQLQGPERDQALAMIQATARPSDELAAIVRTRDYTKLRDLMRNRPPDHLATLLGDLTVEDQVVVFRLLPRKDAAAAFEYLSLEQQEALLKAMAQEDVAAILNEMAPDDRTMFLEELPAPVTRQLLALLTPDERAVARTLLGYPEGSIGRLMTPAYIAVGENWTIQQVLDHIRAHGQDSETLNVIYVVDAQGKLVDDIRIRELLLTSPSNRVADLMDRRFVVLKATDAATTAISEFRTHDRTALPVTDTTGVLIGIVTVDDVLDIVESKTTEDIQRIGGSEALDEPYMVISFARMVRKRAGWLTALFVGEMLTATAMSAFEAEIERAVVLALFVPLIISSGGNSGSQASTLVIRALALGEVTLRDWWRVARREIGAGLALGAILGAIGFLRITIWSAFTPLYGPHWLLVALTVSLALVGIVLWGTLVGSLLPFVLRRLGFDPATSSAPFVATLVDVTGLVIYFSVALLVLRGTLL
jgi:magnesium transporter